MKKYFQVYKTVFLELLAYRAIFFTSLLSIFIRLFVLVFFTRATFEHRENIYGYSISSFATYSIVSAILGSIVSTSINHELSRNIRDGSLADLLIKPIKYNLYRFVCEISGKTQWLLYSFFGLSLLTIFYAKTFPLQVIPSRIFLFSISAIIAFVFNRSFKYIFGTIAFWNKDTGGISNFVNQAIGLLRGDWLPLDFFGPLTSILKILPFSYAFYFPIQILIDPDLNSFDIAKIFLLESVWTIIFLIIGQVLWKKGIRHFESVGI